MGGGVGGNRIRIDDNRWNYFTRFSVPFVFYQIYTGMYVTTDTFFFNTYYYTRRVATVSMFSYVIVELTKYVPDDGLRWRILLKQHSCIIVFVSTRLSDFCTKRHVVTFKTFQNASLVRRELCILFLIPINILERLLFQNSISFQTH